MQKKDNFDERKSQYTLYATKICGEHKIKEEVLKRIIDCFEIFEEKRTLEGVPLPGKKLAEIIRLLQDNFPVADLGTQISQCILDRLKSYYDEPALSEQVKNITVVLQSGGIEALKEFKDDFIEEDYVLLQDALKKILPTNSIGSLDNLAPEVQKISENFLKFTSVLQICYYINPDNKIQSIQRFIELRDLILEDSVTFSNFIVPLSRGLMIKINSLFEDIKDSDFEEFSLEIPIYRKEIKDITEDLTFVRDLHKDTKQSLTSYAFDLQSLKSETELTKKEAEEEALRLHKKAQLSEEEFTKSIGMAPSNWWKLIPVFGAIRHAIYEEEHSEKYKTKISDMILLGNMQQNRNKIHGVMKLISDSITALEAFTESLDAIIEVLCELSINLEKVQTKVQESVKLHKTCQTHAIRIMKNTTQLCGIYDTCQPVFRAMSDLKQKQIKSLMENLKEPSQKAIKLQERIIIKCREQNEYFQKITRTVNPRELELWLSAIKSIIPAIDMRDNKLLQIKIDAHMTELNNKQIDAKKRTPAIEALKTRQRKQICAIDGGGMFGVVSARILAEIEIHLGTTGLYQYFDLFAGTSAGSILASALSLKDEKISMNKYGAFDVIRIFQNERGVIFSDPKSNKFGAKYGSKGLVQVLDKYLGETRLTLDTLVPLYIVASQVHEPGKLSTFEFVYNETNPEITQPTYLLRDAVLASASAPTYFPIVEIKGKKFIDGGLTANNPASRAFDYMLHKHKDLKSKDVIILSIGTGDLPSSKIGNFNEEGQIHWAINGIPTIINQSITDNHNALLSKFKEVPDQYFRFQPTFPEKLEMDDITDDGMLKLLEYTETYLKQPEILDRIKILVKKLQEID